jgi:hypothetical protein
LINCPDKTYSHRRQPSDGAGLTCRSNVLVDSSGYGEGGTSAGRCPVLVFVGAAGGGPP